ncbi:transcriptional protein SWT1 isoform X2 [Elgaria multicarinata webbii]|uniref:transcriptional protein SWT1 isoform X2 n=1 Tax=Elgaria multicarinata webbii TaxID=159646 RepID=UPI002FCCEC56
MSKKHAKKSRKKDETSDHKKHEKAEIASKEQPTQRLGGSAESMKRKRTPDVKDASKVPPKDFLKDTQHICGTLMPAEEREKITMHFQNQVKHGGKRNHMGFLMTFPNKEHSGKNMCSEPDVERKKTESQGLRILKSKEKKKIKTKAEHVRLKEVIVKSVLNEFKETTVPTECSLHHKKETLKLYEFSRKQNTSKEPHPTFPPVNFSGPKSHTQACREGTLERTKHTSLALPSKNDKEKKCISLCHLTELSKCWKYKQKGQSSTDSIKNIGNSRTQRNKFESMAFHISKASCSSSREAIKDTLVDQEMQIVEDLHAARIDKKMALSVVQTCGELTRMEIDLPEDETNMSSRMLSGLNTLIVVDTNIMISHLEYIKFLKNRDIPGIGRFVLVIPWVVLQELDNLKRGKILASVGKKAVPAVHFIYICLKNQDPKLWGQSMQLASQKTHGFSVENNDDRVLQCCLQYQNRFPQAEVVLLTDDKNLCNKALVSEVKAFSKADLVTAVQKLTPKTVVINQNNSDGRSQSVKASGKQGVNINCACLTEAGSKKNSIDLLSQIFLESQKSLGEVLSSILETELKMAYGDLWTEVVYHKPPWTLAKVLECYKKHWMAVFGMIISRSFFSTIEYLYAHLCKAEIIKQSTMKEVLQESKMLLETFSSRSNYDGVLSQALAQMNELLETLEKSDAGPNSSETYKSTPRSAACEKMEAVTLTEHTQAGDKLLSPKPLALGNRHMEIWSVLESVWNTINLFSLEVFQKLDINSVTTTQNMFSFKEAFVGLQKLMAAVNEILAGIRQVLVTNSSVQDVWTLYSFLTNNEINNSIKFTAEELYNCVSQEVYRDRLSIGCGQLAQLEHTVKQCYESVCLEIKNRGWL